MILHLDMDAFFASVEQMDNPDLRGKPVIVGGDQRGVVATASYEARTFGIHSAMPISTARRLCPHGFFLRGRYQRYSELSKKIMAALSAFSPVVQPASIDEAYADLNGLENLLGPPEQIAAAIKSKIFNITGGLTCSIGIAPIKFLAKICSDMNKPDGVYILEAHQTQTFLLTLPIEKLPGVGARMSASLRAMGITTVAALQKLSRNYMTERYGKFGGVLHDRAHGIDPRPVHGPLPAKSEGAERTFSADTTDRNVLEQALLAYSDKVGASLRKQSLAGRTITLKIKYADFQLITRSKTLPERTDSTEIIFNVASTLLAEETLKGPVRLIGVCVSGFEPRSEQYPLPGLEVNAAHRHLRPNTPDRAHKLDLAMDTLRERFGREIIRRGEISPQESPHHFEKKHNLF